MAVKRGQTAGTGNIYTGLLEFEDMSFLLHLMRPDDRMIDVGANIGTYTILAAAVAGASCLSIEPVPDTFASLEANVALNDCGNRVNLILGGAGAREETLRFTTSLGADNHVVGPEETDPSAVDVHVRPLDAIAEGLTPTLLKIDVEGLESAVIAGAHNLLQQSSLLAVILELKGSGQEYGYDEEALHRTMLRHGFAPFRYDPFTRNLQPLEGINSAYRNTLYLRGIDAIRERLAAAPSFKVNGQTI